MWELKNGTKLTSFEVKRTSHLLITFRTSGNKFFYNSIGNNCDLRGLNTRESMMVLQSSNSHTIPELNDPGSSKSPIPGVVRERTGKKRAEVRTQILEFFDRSWETTLKLVGTPIRSGFSGAFGFGIL